MNILIPTPLRSYTGQRVVVGSGSTLGAVLADLGPPIPGHPLSHDQRAGRHAAHVRFFVNGKQVFDLSQPLRSTDEIVIVQALSGG